MTSNEISKMWSVYIKQRYQEIVKKSRWIKKCWKKITIMFIKFWELNAALRIVFLYSHNYRIYRKARKDRERKKDRSRRLNILHKKTLQEISSNFIFKGLHPKSHRYFQTPLNMPKKSFITILGDVLIFLFFSF